MFGSSKKDKRQIKHSAFLSKISKTNDSKSRRRRRPNKKLAASLESLVEALPEVQPSSKTTTADSQATIIKRQSVRTRPGAMKRQSKLEQGEKERFAKNLAGMSRPDTADLTVNEQTAPNATPSRWKALRTFISSTMERLPASST